VQAAPMHVRCSAGQRWAWDGVDFEIVQPSPASYGDASLKPNARGCTLRVSAGPHAMLLAADIEAAQEAQLVAAGAALRADVLLAPHHGSGTSSTALFLQAVRPSVAVFQVGYRNRYRHPKKEVYERYRDMGIARYRTDQTGAVTMQLGASLTVSKYRESNPRYWHGR